MIFADSIGKNLELFDNELISDTQIESSAVCINVSFSAKEISSDIRTLLRLLII